MKSWVLILTIFGNDGTASIDHVAGFGSEAVCMAAGKKWDGTIGTGWFEGGRRTSYVCVETNPGVEK